MNPLSAEQIEEFIERGWTVLGQAFPRTVAEAVVDQLSLEVNCDLRNPDAWTEPTIWLQRTFTVSPWMDAVTERLEGAIDQLVGSGRYLPIDEMGWWPIRFPGFADPPYGDDWHVDGNFPHHLAAPQQALLNLFLFTDVEPGGGGTLVAEGSHHRAAEILAAVSPRTLTGDQLCEQVHAAPDIFGSVAETCGAAGDVVLAHPLILHSSSANNGVRPRVMAQPRTDCRQPKRFVGADLSPVEIVLARAYDRYRRATTA